MAIVVTSAASIFGSSVEIKGATDMAVQLEPLVGSWARISSSPWACLPPGSPRRLRLRWLRLMLPTAFWVEGDAQRSPFPGGLDRDHSCRLDFLQLGSSPVEAILFAQVTNGILLPLVVAYLLWVMNKPGIMGAYRNRWKSNLAGAFVLVVTLGLAVRSLLQVLKLI